MGSLLDIVGLAAGSKMVQFDCANNLSGTRLLDQVASFPA